MSDINGTDAASEVLAMMSFDGGFVTIDGREVFLWQQGMKMLVDEVIPDMRGFTARGQLLIAPIPEFTQADTRTGWYFQMGDDVRWELGDTVDLPDDPAPDDLPVDPEPEPTIEVLPGVRVLAHKPAPASRSQVESSTVSITLRLRDGLVGRLTDAARERVVGRNLLIERLLERALADLPPVDL